MRGAVNNNTMCLLRAAAGVLWGGLSDPASLGPFFGLRNGAIEDTRWPFPLQPQKLSPTSVSASWYASGATRYSIHPSGSRITIRAVPLHHQTTSLALNRSRVSAPARWFYDVPAQARGLWRHALPGICWSSLVAIIDSRLQSSIIRLGRGDGDGVHQGRSSSWSHPLYYRQAMNHQGT